MPEPATKARADLLAWYDRHARVLPWRVPPGKTPDPYRIWLSEIMLQQTTVQAVKGYFEAFVARWGDVAALAAAPEQDVLSQWAGLGYYSRARNLHAASKVLAATGGKFPETPEGLSDLPGIGPYTASAIAAIAFDHPTVPLDGNIERVTARYFAIEEPLPGSKKVLREAAQAFNGTERPGCVAQALMDLGATICTPKRPACVLCPLNENCEGFRLGIAETLPRKAPKAERPTRRGAAFVASRPDGALLVRSRPRKGLLAGMSEVPGSEWTQGFKPEAGLAHAPIDATWRKLTGPVRHGFTHFQLELDVYAASVPESTPAPDGMRWVAPGDMHREAFPTVMRKVLAHAGVE
ncbi:A/G-specific adenine glycosylase [Tepidamorphus sp. 3E244]|uniref:A/G-specific adenine glycosylase n=1 Tax=Tepidamorphus sp. 3E244 TaxID=3385498 RepID=UPI0038FC7CBD